MPRIAHATLVLAALTAFCLCTAACTRVVVHKDPDHHDKGIRYYRPKPYLFITPDSGGGGGGSTFSVNQGKALQLEVTQKQAAADGSGSGITQTGFDQPSVPSQPPVTTPPLTPPAIPTTPPPTAGKPVPPDTGKPAAPQAGTKISMQMMYLPDFAEEYSIQLRPGLGVGELNVKLDNGWNLTSVGLKTDQQTDEILKSTADLVTSIGGLVAPGGTKQKADGSGSGQEVKVLATNIPFGFYEAVIATDPRGRKQLYGWRYVGFMPFQACPTDAGGAAAVCCNDPDAVYGMVMDSDGVLVFKKIAEIPHAGLATKPTTPPLK